MGRDGDRVSGDNGREDDDAAPEMPTPGQATSRSNFAAWILEDLNTVCAMRDTPRDAQLQEFVTEGYLALAEETVTDRTYSLTAKAFCDLAGAGN